MITKLRDATILPRVPYLIGSWLALTVEVEHVDEVTLTALVVNPDALPGHLLVSGVITARTGEGGVSAAVTFAVAMEGEPGVVHHQYIYNPAMPIEVGDPDYPDPVVEHPQVRVTFCRAAHLPPA